MSKSGYPVQPSAPNPYTASGYPAQPPPYSPPGAPQPGYHPSQYMYGGQAGAPMMSNQQVPQAQYANYHQPYPQHSMPSSAPPPYSQAAYPQAQYVQAQPQVVYGGAMFDSGARFDGVSQPTIPPPPPGCAPTGAQMAAMQGHTVVGSQQNSNWFTGGSSGGVTFW